MAEAPAWARGMVAALARGDHGYVLHNGALALDAAGTDAGLRARVHCWLAQAHLGRGQREEARSQLVQALRAAREAGDEAGVQQIRALRARVLALPEPAAPEVESPEAEAAGSDPTEGEAELAPALAALRAGRHEEALALARKAREEGRMRADPRAEVLALLLIARVPGHAEAALLAAHERADLSGEPNLVAAVTKAGRELKVDLGLRIF